MSLRISRLAQKNLSAYTLAEMLVVMIVSGIVILLTMDGWALFSRYTAVLSKRITTNSALYDGYYRLHELATNADSITADATFWRAGEPIKLTLQDSTLIIKNDTILTGVSELKIADSLTIKLRDIKLTWPLKNERQ